VMIKTPTWMNSMLWVLCRLALGAFLLSSVAFLLVQLSPGDPVQRVLGPGATAEDIERTRTALGLDAPLIERYVLYLGDTLSLDLGNSFRTSQPVIEILIDRAPQTLELAFAGLVVAFGVSIPLGVAMAAITVNEKRKNLTALFTAVTGLLAAIPPYVLAMMLVAAFAVGLRLLPIAGAEAPGALLLPALATGLPFAAILVRIVRVETISVLQSDYVRTVRSKHLPTRLLYLKHVLPNVLTGALTIGGVFVGYLLAGSVVVESVFAWPGVGTELARAITDRDYPVLQGAILFLGLAVLIVNGLVDVLLAALDPRLRSAT
jgi:peptide/nickel transport system permease protein